MWHIITQNMWLKAFAFNDSSTWSLDKLCFSVHNKWSRNSPGHVPELPGCKQVLIIAADR